MAEDLKSAIAQKKQELKQLLQRVPASVNSGSYQRAVAYKDAAKRGQKLLDSSSARLAPLQQVVNDLKQFQ